MAAPSYTEDLTDVDLAETTTGWSAYGGGASGLSASPDIAMQGTNCVDKNVTGAGTDKGQYFDNGSGITLPANAHVWVWHFCGTPGLTDTRANKGASILVGSLSTAYCQYHVEGNNTYGASGRVARCYPIDYSVRTSNGSEPYRTVTGSPGANPRVFGGGLVTTATVKGANVGIDAIRYGTGAYLTAGELLSAGDGSDNPCTFAGFQAQNDAVSNRWGILSLVGGGYELQGRFVIGQNNAGTATLARFSDSNKSISFVDTIHAAADFTQIIIDHASTVCILTNISLTALGTTNRGRFIVNSANPQVDVTGGTWTDIGIITLRSNSTLDGVILRNTGQITQNGAAIENCTVNGSQASAAILSNNPQAIQNNDFISDGTGHAIEITTPGTYTFTGNTFTGYAGTDGSTGNEAIYNNSGGAVTINVAGGGDTPTIRNGSGASTTVNNNISVTLTGLKDNTEVAVYNTSTGNLIAEAEPATGGSPNNRSFTFSEQAGVNVYITVLNLNWILPPNNRISNFVVPSVDTSIPITQVVDRTYNNP